MANQQKRIGPAPQADFRRALFPQNGGRLVCVGARLRWTIGAETYETNKDDANADHNGKASRHGLILAPFPSQFRAALGADRSRSLKLLRGNFGKRALRENEPEPIPGRPMRPRGLTPQARAEWVSACCAAGASDSPADDSSMSH